MRTVLITLPLSGAKDMAHCRQQVRELCGEAQSSAQETTRFATAVSEVTRQAVRHGGGTAEIAIEIEDQRSTLHVVVRDQGTLTPDPGPRSPRREESLDAARKLNSFLDVEPLTGGGFAVTVSLPLIERKPPDAITLEQWRAMMQRRSGVTADELLAQQNRELTQTMLALQRRESELRIRVDEIRSLNQELETNNKGLVKIHTQLAERNKELDEARRVAETATDTKASFLANMSHEIRTPMNAVVGLTDLLRRTPLDEVQREHVNIIQSSAAHLLEILDDILDFSKIESDKLELEKRCFRLRDCIESAIELVSVRASEKSLDVICLIAASVPEWVLGDETRVRQILVNYLSNAIKFTDTGEIVVTGTASPLPHGEFQIRMEVQDTGIGIAEDRRDRLFQSFSQADTSTTREFGGTGLGLAICKRLAEMMGGSVGASSEPGVGSNFWFSLQVALPQEPPQGLASDSLPALEGRRILVVAKSAALAAMLGQMMEAWHISAVVANDVENAIAQLRSPPNFDAAIIDSSFCEQDPAGLSQQIQEAVHGSQSLPLVLLGAQGSASPGSRYFASVLAKPTRQAALFDVLVWLFAKGGISARKTLPGERRLSEREEDYSGNLNLKILLTEDNSVNQMVAVKMLELLGCTVDVAENGREAVRCAEQNTYDLILMDMHMPVLDGISATREIRRILNPERSPPIVAMTASALEGERERCLAAGMQDFLAKPVQLANLADALQRNTQHITSARSSKPDRPVLETADQSQTGEKLNPSALQGLEHALGQESVLETLDALAEDMPRLSVGIADAARSSDSKAVKFYAHTMRSCAAMVGAEEVAALCQDIEASAESKTNSHLFERAIELSRRYRALVEQVGRDYRSSGH
tara:strand:+ start:8417 stop:11041 length:2625 start_codon:yes stop_codon:yes gene_type:complete